MDALSPIENNVRRASRDPRRVSVAQNPSAAQVFHEYSTELMAISTESKRRERLTKSMNQRDNLIKKAKDRDFQYPSFLSREEAVQKNETQQLAKIDEQLEIHRKRQTELAEVFGNITEGRYRQLEDRLTQLEGQVSLNFNSAIADIGNLSVQHEKLRDLQEQKDKLIESEFQRIATERNSDHSELKELVGELNLLKEQVIENQKQQRGSSDVDSRLTAIEQRLMVIEKNGHPSNGPIYEEPQTTKEKIEMVESKMENLEKKLSTITTRVQKTGDNHIGLQEALNKGSREREFIVQSMNSEREKIHNTLKGSNGQMESLEKKVTESVDICIENDKKMITRIKEIEDTWSTHLAKMHYDNNIVNHKANILRADQKSEFDHLNLRIENLKAEWAEKFCSLAKDIQNLKSDQEQEFRIRSGPPPPLASRATMPLTTQSRTDYSTEPQPLASRATMPQAIPTQPRADYYFDSPYSKKRRREDGFSGQGSDKA